MQSKELVMNVDSSQQTPSTDNAAPCRTIMLTGLAAGRAVSETAISLLDDKSETLQKAPINEDGSCDLSVEALTAAHQVVLQPDNASVPAERLRWLLQTTDTIDVDHLVTQPAAAACHHIHHRPKSRDYHRD
jgi:hypothetical protein